MKKNEIITKINSQILAAIAVKIKETLGGCSLKLLISKKLMISKFLMKFPNYSHPTKHKKLTAPPSFGGGQTSLKNTFSMAVSI